MFRRVLNCMLSVISESKWTIEFKSEGIYSTMSSYELCVTAQTREVQSLGTFTGVLLVCILMTVWLSGILPSVCGACLTRTQHYTTASSTSPNAAKPKFYVHNNIATQEMCMNSIHNYECTFRLNASVSGMEWQLSTAVLLVTQTWVLLCWAFCSVLQLELAINVAREEEEDKTQVNSGIRCVSSPLLNC